MGVRGSVGVGGGLEVDVCVCLAGGLSDGVALTVVVGARVGLGVAVAGSTVSKSVALLSRLRCYQRMWVNKRTSVLDTIKRRVVAIRNCRWRSVRRKSFA